MPIDLDRVRHAKALIDPQLGAPQLRSQFHTLAADLFLARQANDPDQHPRMAGHIRIIDERVSELVTVGHKLQWQLTQHLEGHLPWDVWILFASLDLAVFLMLLRSSLDHAAGVVEQVAPATNGQRRRFRSFNKLHDFAERPEGLAYLGTPARDLVLSCDWFSDVKGWRDSIVHDGSRLLVTNDGPRPVFMIVSGTTFRMNIPEVMRNTNVVDYWHFAGLYIAYLLCFLDDLALLVRATLPTASFNARPALQHPGLVFLRRAMDELAP